MKTVDIIERIEGEARLRLSWKDKKVSHSQIEFLNFRGFEYILQNKPILDALIYNPRICGICGQAHLLTTVNAIENLYANANVDLEISPKAKILRELGLSIEILDSHFKWFYMFIMPDLVSLSDKIYHGYDPLKGEKWLRANKVASETIKALAIYAGQWPHTSYMVPGGVMSDPTLLDLATIENYIDQAIIYTENNILGVSIDDYLAFDKVKDLEQLTGDLRDFSDISFETSMHTKGQSFDRHMVLGDSLGFKTGKITNKNVYKVNKEKISESDEFCFDPQTKEQSSSKYGWAKTVKYNSEVYEVGPLSRALVSNRGFVKSLHKEYKDSVLTRVFGRMDELVFLLEHTKQLLKKIDVSEPSFIEPKISLKEFDGIKANATVEACRGSLFHELIVKSGKIVTYDVITPTVWNLGPGTAENPGVAQKALLGLNSLKEATVVLRSFDVCSVCTTH